MIVRATLLALVAATPVLGQGHGIGDRFDDPMEIARDAISAFAPGQEGLPGISVDISTDRQGRITILVARTGLLDDSVNGERTQYLLEPTAGGGWVVSYMQVDFLCRRGPNTVTWQSGLCP